MGTHTPKERLSHLLELAAQGPQQAAALAGELVDLLLDWPANYPVTVRSPFEALLEKTARMLDAQTRASLAERFAERDDLPADLLNAFFLEAPATLKDHILARNESIDDRSGEAVGVLPDSAALLDAVREMHEEDFARHFAAMLAIPTAVAEKILDDASTRSLAAACKGAHLDRAAYSAIVLLATPKASIEENFARLSAYDAVPQRAAERLTRYWQTRRRDEFANHARAAE